MTYLGFHAVVELTVTRVLALQPWVRALELQLMRRRTQQAAVTALEAIRTTPQP